MAPNSRPRRGSSRLYRARWKSTYDRTPYHELPWFYRGPSDTVLRAMRGRFLSPPGSLVDIGCGAGSNSLYLARKGFDVTGVDISPGAIRAAEGRATAAKIRARFVVGDALDLALPDRSRDAAIDIGCFHALPIGRRRDYAREISRVLRPNGRFVLSWVARENTAERGPPHRPALEEVARALESEFRFERTMFHAYPGSGGLATYDAWMRRRSEPQPPPR